MCIPHYNKTTRLIHFTFFQLLSPSTFIHPRLLLLRAWLTPQELFP